MADDLFAAHLANNYLNDKGPIDIAQLNTNSNGSGGQQNQAQVPTRDWGWIKWQANPYPEWQSKLHGKVGSALGGVGGGIVGNAITGGAAGSILPGWGTAAGIAAGGIAGAFAEDALDYIGIPSNVEVNLPSVDISLPNIPEQVEPSDTSRPGSGLEFQPPRHPSPSSR